jgi:hypothetical protein
VVCVEGKVSHAGDAAVGSQRVLTLEIVDGLQAGWNDGRAGFPGFLFFRELAGPEDDLAVT